MNTSPNKTFTFNSYIGTIDQIFGLMGKDDALTGKKLLEHLKRPLTHKNKQIDRLLKTAQALLCESFKKKNPRFYKIIESYAKGLNIDPKLVTQAILIPEVISSLPRIITGNSLPLFGCSTLVNNKSFIRILDFPLGETFRNNERGVFLKPTGKNKTLSFGAKGFPFASISAVNEFGLILSIHQKFSPRLNLLGQSIFEITQQIMFEAKNLNDVINIVNNSKSIGTWGINIKQENTFLQIEISGKKKSIKKIELTDEIHAVFNENDISLNGKNIFPHGLEFNNLSRRNYFNKYIKGKTLNLNQIVKDYKFNSKLESPIITASSVGIYEFTSSTISVLSDNSVFDTKSFDTNNEPSFIFNRELSLDSLTILNQVEKAQTAIDFNDTTKAYHHLQKAINKAKNTPYEYRLTLLYSLLRFQTQTNPKVLEVIIDDLKNILQHLGEYHQDIARLFIFRIEKILKVINVNNIKEIKNKTIINLIRKERRIPNILYKRIIQNSFVIRLDIEDVVHLH